jgi:hypothetical protein
MANLHFNQRYGQRALACFEAGALGRLFAVTSSICFNGAGRAS